MALQLKELSNETLKEIAPVALTHCSKIPTKKTSIIKEFKEETKQAGVKELAFMMNNLELKEICDNYIQVEYKAGANKNNKMMLTKRFMESFEEESIESWVKNCDDKDILVIMCTAMDIVLPKKISLEDLQKLCISQIQFFGESVILHRMTINQLRDICYETGIEGYDNTSSKRILINAILTKSDIPKPEKKVVKIPKKTSIHKATQYLQLSEYYKASELESWCKENGLKTSGNKKTLINRILDFNDGDTENTMSTNTPKKKTSSTSKKNTSTSKKTKSKPKKASLPPKTIEVEETNEPSEEPSEEPSVEPSEEDVMNEDVSEEQEDKQTINEEVSEEQEDSYDEEAAKKAIDAERELRVTEEEEDSDIEISFSTSNTLDITGVVFAISGKFANHTKTQLKDIIEKNGGKYIPALRKETQVYIAGEGAKGVSQAKKKGIQIESEEYLAPFF